MFPERTNKGDVVWPQTVSVPGLEDTVGEGFGFRQVKSCGQKRPQKAIAAIRYFPALMLESQKHILLFHGGSVKSKAELQVGGVF